MIIINQPRNISGVNGSFEFKWNPNFSSIRAERLNQAQMYVDSEAIRLMVPYTPMDNGPLAESVKIGTVIGSGKLQYKSPYARYQYYGEVYGPNIPIFESGISEPVAFFSPRGQKKFPTGRQLKYNTSKHPKAGKMWFERMKADHKRDIAKGAAKIAGGISK